MGPYMSPIPINASIGMLISLAVAFVVTPWLTLKIIGSHAAHGGGGAEGVPPRLFAFFQRRVGPFLGGADGGPRRRKLAGWMLLLILLSMGLAAAKLVVLKMLPFDNKSEFQVIVDLPEGH
jgi:multidrug efflux pump subunit AcrB